MIVDEVKTMDRQMRAISALKCYVCGANSELLHLNLRDRLFDAPGVWNIRICRGAGCGLAWLDPMPIEEDIHIAYRNYYTHVPHSANVQQSIMARAYKRMKEAYCAEHYGYGRPTSQMWSRLYACLLPLYPGRSTYAGYDVMYLPARRDGRLLDVGCGNGAFLSRMAELGWQVQGIDVDAAAVSYARKSGVEVFHGTLEAAPFPEESFDAITMAHVIEHVHRPLDVLTVARRLLKPGGVVSIVTPNSRSLAHRIYGRHTLLLDPPRHLHIFTVSSLSVLLERAGYKSATIRTTSHAAHGMFVASRSIRLSGSYRNSPAPRIGEEIWSRSMEMAEWLLLTLRPDVGEEIACVATK